MGDLGIFVLLVSCLVVLLVIVALACKSIFWLYRYFTADTSKALKDLGLDDIE